MRKLVRLSDTYLCITVAVFSILSKIIFEKVYSASEIVVDEEFHLALGKAYCNFDYHLWHPKITTLPGLYLISSFLLGPLKLCSTYWLRSVSLIASVCNIFLFYKFLNLCNANEPAWKNIISAVNLALLPPLYFFSHLYYTDIISVTTILLLLIWSLLDKHYFASLTGMLAILIRQTNVIWIGLAVASFISKELYRFYLGKSPKTSRIKIPAKDIHMFLKIIKNNKLWSTLKKTTLMFWLNVTSYSVLLFSFILFIYLNGSIVVGDKLAHKATLHLPQIFYFSLFSLFFGWPHFLPELGNFYKFLKSHKLFVIFFLILSLIIIHYNTLVHPYILADNRHYIFYIWNRFYGKYYWFRFVMIPVYLFALYVIISKIWHRDDVSFVIWFIICSFIVLVTNQLLELRYFFIPYILFRMQLRNVSVIKLLLEFSTYCLVNTATFYLFFNKTIDWNDYDYPQRLIW